LKRSEVEKMATTLDFDHVFINCADIDANVAFYRDVLGMAVESEWGDRESGRGAILTSGTLRVNLGEEHAGDVADTEPYGYRGARPTLHVRVPDLDEWFSKRAQSENLIAPPQPTHWGGRWALFRDANGNIVAVISE
jgi:catechol 2,3-dioxygenase-like lactoylglutathione lyase family enzyme